MKKLYSKKLGGEAFALDAGQLNVFKGAGYTVPSPEEVITDAAAVRIVPPEGKRAYVVFDFTTGVFSVRAKTATLDGNEVGGFVGEVVQAALLCRFLEQADPDRTKTEAIPVAKELSPLVAMLKNAFNAAASKAATNTAVETETQTADAPEVIE